MTFLILLRDDSIDNRSNDSEIYTITIWIFIFQRVYSKDDDGKEKGWKVFDDDDRKWGKKLNEIIVSFLRVK